MTDRTLILDPQRMARSIERMAWEIMEHHQDEAVVWVVGISESGYKLAQLLQEHLVKHAKFKSHLVEITINKKNPSKGPTTCSEDIQTPERACECGPKTLRIQSRLACLQYSLRFPTQVGPRPRLHASLDR